MLKLLVFIIRVVLGASAGIGAYLTAQGTVGPGIFLIAGGIIAYISFEVILSKTRVPKTNQEE